MKRTVQASKLALGTAQFGYHYGIANQKGKISQIDAALIFEYAISSGLDTLDTAIAYGESEKVLGALGVKQWNIISKLPSIPEDCVNISEWVNDSIESSLERMKVDKLEALLLHCPEQLLGPHGEKLYLALSELKSNALVNKIGISIYNPLDLEKLLADYSFDVVQAPYNILDQRMSTSGVFSMLHNDNVEIHVRSVFLQGLLLMSESDRPDKFARWNKLWTNWHSWLKDTKIDAVDACIRFVLSNQFIDKVIIGIDSLKHFQKIIKAMEGSVPNYPSDLCCKDIDLINPSRWEYL